MVDYPILIETLGKCIDGLYETTGRLHFITVAAPREDLWDQVRVDVSCLDSIADVMGQALDAMKEDGE